MSRSECCRSWDSMKQPPKPITQDDIRALLMDDLRKIGRRRKLGVEKTKLRIQMLQMLQNLSPAVPDKTGVEELDWDERQKRIKEEARGKTDHN